MFVISILMNLYTNVLIKIELKIKNNKQLK